MGNISRLLEFFGFLDRLQDSFREKVGKEPTEEVLKTSLGIHFNLSEGHSETIVEKFLKKEEE